LGKVSAGAETFDATALYLPFGRRLKSGLVVSI
jgi:hypothetical protein